MAKRLSESERNTICNLYMTGKSAREISQFMNVGYSTIFEVLRVNNIPKQKGKQAENARVKYDGVETRDANAKQITFADWDELTPDEPTATASAKVAAIRNAHDVFIKAFECYIDAVITIITKGVDT